MTTRSIYKSSWQCRYEAREIIEGIFAAEWIRPSRCLWFVSPWISDIAVLDNRAAAFETLSHEWGQRPIRLAEFLAHNMTRGTIVVVATRPDGHNDYFLDTLREAADDSGVTDQLIVPPREEDLHEKGILGDSFHLGGSMNLTYHGVEINEESLQFTTETRLVAEVRLRYYKRWGGEP